jgi:hypothetical protein
MDRLVFGQDQARGETLVLDIDSSESPTYSERKASVSASTKAFANFEIYQFSSSPMPRDT